MSMTAPRRIAAVCALSLGLTLGTLTPAIADPKPAPRPTQTRVDLQPQTPDGTYDPPTEQELQQAPDATPEAVDPADIPTVRVEQRAAAPATCPAVFGAVGSSHTDGGFAVSHMVSDDGDMVPGTFLDQDAMVPSSWAYHAARDPYLRLDGGWALGGSTMRDLADKIEPWMFTEGSYAVILAGTVDNLPEHMNTAEETLRDLPRLIANTGVPRDHILLVNLPPVRYLEQRIIDYNELLEDYATANGIRLFDLHSLVSTGYTWRPGYDADGVHFQRPVAALVGQAIADQLNDMSGCVTEVFTQRAHAAGLGAAMGDTEFGLVDGGKRQRFVGGAVYSSLQSPPVAVPTQVHTPYMRLGGVDGALGYPLAAAECDAGACTQMFTGGRMVVGADGSARATAWDGTALG